MKMKRTFTVAIAALGLGLASAHAVDGDAKSGQQAAAICAACHQVDGNGMNIPGGESWPRLAGLDADYLLKQLQDMKSGKRTSATMTPFANMLSEQQMRDVAVYFSQLPTRSAKGGEKASADELAHGEKLATVGDWDRYIVPCQSCHGPDNQGVGAHFPGIAGQHADYLAGQLRAWKNGTRDNDPQHLMLAIAERLDERDIRAVSQWLSRQSAR
ncbi:MAG: c-type cytochrome [Pseudomonas sp.]|jgi:cytochrome c553|nr:c-type cytochrome [Pseudomonas sp.]